MSLTDLLPKRLYHASRIELWGRGLAGDELPAPLLPSGFAAARLVGREAAATARGHRLAEAMAPAPPDEVETRLASGRRAYVVEGPPGVVAYGWVTIGHEQIAEVEGTIRVGAGEAYIWDCATLPRWRGRGLYPALLRAIARDLAAEGLEWAWIAARPENVPSLRGFAKAGYVRIADIDYRRLWRWRRLAVHADAGASAARSRSVRRIVA